MTNSKKSDLAVLDGDTPTLRLFSLLEIIAKKDEFFSLQDLTEETNIPKPSLHRMLQQLESAGIIQRDGDERHYGSGARLRHLAEDVLLNSTTHSARHQVLSQLRDEVGESCNLTSLSGGEVIYVDRVETEAPLRFHLHPGSKVPVHCSATGKLFLANMAPSQRRRLLSNAELTAFTEKTIIDMSSLEKELENVKACGYGIDNEEFLPGLLCVAVLVPSKRGRSNLAVAIQAPIMRLKAEQALHFLPALQRASLAFAKIEDESWGDDH
ncbi:IclR family transcriptional regulator [Enterovibrio sp. ZSDZ42]|uniref:HTH-type transcriptional repressor AllR n=1 Tax=Enterovibrio gelatinilyticus TaxID=2899819 RepID=A0ABT5QZM2_9GAMM|nr:IclR family transcriptional regulator [Enterovibrio sp. ZSDZ42]MDD1793434.1 IclR family transcriptional regulator [Enterovibrio sp. ZSDZ42]